MLKVLTVWRNNFPTFARGRLSASLFYRFVNFCDKHIGFPLLCSDFERLRRLGCEEMAGYTIWVADPTSTGQLFLDFFGNLQIDGGYLQTEEDIEALGIAVRSGYEQIMAREGPSAFQRPCEDPNDVECTSKSCPEVWAYLNSFQKDVLGFLDPAVSEAIPDAPPSVIAPPFIEQLILTEPDDLKLGKLLRNWIMTGFHYAGTAAIGKVVDDNLKVLGVDGLYIGDASVLPQTPRVNLMPTVLMLGRMAALKYLDELALR